jgi:hypothetical protein
VDADLPPVMTGPPTVHPNGGGTPDQTGGAEVLDFTIKREPLWFRIDDDLFQAAPALPAGVAFQFAELASTLGGDSGDERVAQARAAMTLFEKILYPDSYRRFQERMHSVEQPIDPHQLFQVVSGLMARYGLRPTEPSADSSASPEPPADGTNSTDAPPPPASTSPPSPSTASATTPTPPSSPA